MSSKLSVTAIVVIVGLTFFAVMVSAGPVKPPSSTPVPTPPSMPPTAIDCACPTEPCSEAPVCKDPVDAVCVNDCSNCTYHYESGGTPVECNVSVLPTDECSLTEIDWIDRRCTESADCTFAAVDPCGCELSAPVNTSRADFYTAITERKICPVCPSCPIVMPIERSSHCIDSLCTADFSAVDPCVSTGCLTDPCDDATCDAHPDAICLPNYCGGCNAVFYDNNGTKVNCGDAPSPSAHEETETASVIDTPTVISSLPTDHVFTDMETETPTQQVTPGVPTSVPTDATASPPTTTPTASGRTDPLNSGSQLIASLLFAAMPFLLA